MLGVNLRKAMLMDARLSLASVSGDLSEVNLRNSDLSYADLSASDLSGADLRGADLNKANFYNAIMDGADLRGCLNWTSEQLNEAASLVGAKLPEGYVPPDETGF